MSKIGKDGKPIDKSYLEVGLPKGVTEDMQQNEWNNGRERKTFKRRQTSCCRKRQKS